MVRKRFCRFERPAYRSPVNMAVVGPTQGPGPLGLYLGASAYLGGGGPGRVHGFLADDQRRSGDPADTLDRAHGPTPASTQRDPGIALPAPASADFLVSASDTG